MSFVLDVEAQENEDMKSREEQNIGFMEQLPSVSVAFGTGSSGW